MMAMYKDFLKKAIDDTEKLQKDAGVKSFARRERQYGQLSQQKGDEASGKEGSSTELTTKSKAGLSENLMSTLSSVPKHSRANSMMATNAATKKLLRKATISTLPTTAALSKDISGLTSVRADKGELLEAIDQSTSAMLKRKSQPVGNLKMKLKAAKSMDLTQQIAGIYEKKKVASYYVDSNATQIAEPITASKLKGPPGRQGAAAQPDSLF